MHGVNNGVLDKIDDFIEVMLTKVFPTTLAKQDDVELLKTVTTSKDAINPRI